MHTEEQTELEVCTEPFTHPSTCRNCETPLPDRYCPHCGQVDKHVDPSLHDLIHELTHEFLHLDGKIVLTLKALILSPGRLTAEYLAGRRARYIGPVRLYLTFSLIFFLLLAYAPGERKNKSHRAEPNVPAEKARGTEKSNTTAGPKEIASSSDKTEQSGAEANIELDLAGKQQDANVEGAVNEELKKNGAEKTLVGKFVSKIVTKASKHGEEVKHQYLTNLSRVMFVMVPLFAVGLRLAYRNRKRRYPSFVYFSIHFHSFVFFVLTLYLVAVLTRVPAVQGPAATTVLLWMHIYLFMALRRVFGGSKRNTIIRMIALGAFYLPCFAVGLGIAGVVALLM
jgi:hypothetical protein